MLARRDMLALLAAVPAYFDGAAMRGSCRFFLDSASLHEYRALLPTGMFHGVTTNPSILQRDGVLCSVDAISVLVRKQDSSPPPLSPVLPGTWRRSARSNAVLAGKGGV